MRRRRTIIGALGLALFTTACGVGEESAGSSADGAGGDGNPTGSAAVDAGDAGDTDGSAGADDGGAPVERTLVSPTDTDAPFDLAGKSLPEVGATIVETEPEPLRARLPQANADLELLLATAMASTWCWRWAGRAAKAPGICF